uniref:Trihelix family transcription factor n=1 Tax=Paeonia rockii TaxID=62886 RepID=A0A977XE28_9MAGN|nr:trihelix family transcription factor [Paeonia rockii]
MENQGGHTTTARSRHRPLSRTTGSGGREDCWSEGSTATLVEAWGERFLELKRGNLRQKDWKEVADAVNDRSNGVKPRRTDIQCKNRIDTLKKKYKLEKSKPPPSKWLFYSRLDHLIGAPAAVPANKRFAAAAPPQHRSPAVTFTTKTRKEKPNAVVVYSGGSSSKSRLNSTGSTGSSRGGGIDDRDDDEVDEDVLDRRHGKHRMESMELSDEAACRELARAVLKFGEIYERIESSKQHQMMELEKQKMEFTKDLEFQRLHMFMDAQIELEKMKRPKLGSTSGKKL